MSLLFTLAQLDSAHAQDARPAKAPVAFEVATVKPDDPNKMVMMDLRVYPGGRLVIHGHVLRSLIADAFGLAGWQVTGGEKWVDTRFFDVEGKPPEEIRDRSLAGEFSNIGIQNAEIRSMLQALLIERFHLKFHMEGQPGTVYSLERGNGPLRLQPAELNLYKKAEDGSISPSRAYPTGDVGMVSGRPVGIHQTSMLQLASVLGYLQHAPVHDETSLPGFYNFTSQMVLTNEDFKNGGPMHLLLEAIPEMGLKLVKKQGTVEKFVIDHAEPPIAD